MGTITEYVDNEILDHIFESGAYTPVAAVFVALSTADPTHDGSGLTEPATANGYTRETCAFGAAAARKITQTTDPITFPANTTADWGSITHWAICDSVDRATGNVLAHGAFDVAKTVNKTNVCSIAVGEIEIGWDANEMSDYLANKILDFVFRNQAFAQPTIHIALCDAVINDANTGATISEPAGNAYVRKAHAAWDAAAGGATENTGAIQFAIPTGSWGNITAVAITDALATGAGNLLFYGNGLDDDPDDGDTVQFVDGALVVALT